jgi:hypothetical protein
VILWTSFLVENRKYVANLYLIGTAVLALVMAARVVASIIKDGGKNWVLAAVLANAFLLVWCDFAIIYWNIGTAKNFGTPLTHLDAIYFSLGTLTTAGTGRILAKSELATVVVTAQMLIDLLLFSVVITLGISRLGEGLKDRISKTASEDSAKQ